jgi:hypothetical protein
MFQYGAALLEDGQADEAGRTFDRLVAIAPDAPEGWFGRALRSARRGDRGPAAEGLAAANQRVEAATRRRLAEQGLKGEALDRATAETTRRSREQMEAEPAFAPFAADPGFRQAAGFASRTP